MIDPRHLKSIVSVIMLVYLLLQSAVSANQLYAQGRSIPQDIKAEIARNDQLVDKYTSEGNLTEAASYLNRSAHLLLSRGLNNEAAEYYSRILEINQQLNNQAAIQRVSNTLGGIYLDLENYEKAILHFQKALQLSKQFRQQAESVSCLTNIALAQQGLNRHKDAVITLEEAINIAKELNDLKLLRRCYGLAYDSYDKTGNSNKSREYFELYSTLDKELKKQEMDRVKVTAESEVNKAQAARQMTEEELKINKEQLKVTSDSLMAA